MCVGTCVRFGFSNFYSRLMTFELCPISFYVSLYTHTCICFSWSTFLRLSFYPHPVISCFFSPLRTSLQNCPVGKGRGRESKVQVRSFHWWVTERQLLPTVCKYVVSLIERSSTSQQLSFLCACVRLQCVWLCVCASEATAGALGSSLITHLCTQIARCPNQDVFVIVRKMLPLSFPSLSHTHTHTAASLSCLHNYRLWDPCLEAVVWLALLSLH